MKYKCLHQITLFLCMLHQDEIGHKRHLTSLRRLSHRCGFAEGFCCNSSVSSCYPIIVGCCATVSWSEPSCTSRCPYQGPGIDCRIYASETSAVTKTVWAGTGVQSISTDFTEFFSAPAACGYNQCNLFYASGVDQRACVS